MSEREHKEEVFYLLEEIGAVKAEVVFSGGHDDGGPDDVRILLGDGTSKHIREWGEEYTEEERDLAHLLAAPVYENFGGFAFEGYVSGTVVYDLKERTAVMRGEEEIQTWEGFERSL
jgi:hypothetical protein